MEMQKKDGDKQSYYLFSISELKMMANALTHMIECADDDKDGEKEALRNDLLMCVEGKL